MRQVSAHKRAVAFNLFGYYDESGAPYCISHSLGFPAHEYARLPDELRKLASVRNGIIGDRDISAFCKTIKDTASSFICEVNPKLFSSIDALEKQGIDVVGLEFHGLEPYDIFRSTVKAIHPGKNIRVSASWREIMNIPRSSACRNLWPGTEFDSTEEHTRWLSQFGGTNSIIWFSPGKEESVNHLGIHLLLMSLPDFIEQMQSYGHKPLISSARNIDFFGTPLIEIECSTLHSDFLQSSHYVSQESWEAEATNAPSSIPAKFWKPPTSLQSHHTNRLDSFFFANAPAFISKS